MILPFDVFVALRYLREGRFQTGLVIGASAVGVTVLVFLRALRRNRAASDAGGEGEAADGKSSARRVRKRSDADSDSASSDEDAKRRIFGMTAGDRPGAMRIARNTGMLMCQPPSSRWTRSISPIG